MDELVDGRKDLPIFLHSELDEYGLDPYEFRIYARLSRRAQGQSTAMESISNMAKGALMSKRKARYAIQFLFKAGLILKKHRSGRSSIITLTPKELWAPKWRLEELRREMMLQRKAKETKQPGSKGETEAKHPQGEAKESNLTGAAEVKDSPSTLPTEAPDALLPGQEAPGTTCRTPRHQVPHTEASGAAHGSFSQEVSPGVTTTTTSARARATPNGVYDSAIIEKLESNYSHLDVRAVRDKMVEHCRAKGKTASVNRLIAWLNFEHKLIREQSGETTHENQNGKRPNAKKRKSPTWQSKLFAEISEIMAMNFHEIEARLGFTPTDTDWDALNALRDVITEISRDDVFTKLRESGASQAIISYLAQKGAINDQEERAASRD